MPLDLDKMLVIDLDDGRGGDGTPANGIITEDGDYMITEDGDYIIQE